MKFVYIKNNKAFQAKYMAPWEHVSANYDYALNVKLFNESEKGFTTLEKAESWAREAIKLIYDYKHTKCKRVTTDFNVFSCVIFDGKNDVDYWSDGTSMGKIKDKYPQTPLVNGFDKRFKVDFGEVKSKENEVIKQRALDLKKRDEEILKEELANPWNRLDKFFDDPFRLKYDGVDLSLDRIPHKTNCLGNGQEFIDAAHLASEYCFVWKYKNKWHIFNTEKCSFVWRGTKDIGYTACSYTDESAIVASLDHAKLLASANGWSDPIFLEKNQRYFMRQISNPIALYRGLVLLGKIKEVEEWKK